MNRNDEDDCEPLPKKFPHDNQLPQHLRKRLPKRYSDIVGPTSNKVYLPRKDSIIRGHQIHRTSSPSIRQTNSLKTKSNETLHTVDFNNKKPTEQASSLPKSETRQRSIVARRYSSKNKRLVTSKAVDLLAHRMQAAMSAELMHSLDRNFVFSERKLPLNHISVNRSQSTHITSSPKAGWWGKSSDKEHVYHIIPRVKHCFDGERKSMQTISSSDELTPDYDEDNIILQSIGNISKDDTCEEPTADYDDSKSTIDPDAEEKIVASASVYDLGVSSSYVVHHTSITPSSETFTQDQSSIPPTPPPLPYENREPKRITVRCRTIADTITADHKLILKDKTETIEEVSEEERKGKL